LRVLLAFSVAVGVLAVFSGVALAGLTHNLTGSFGAFGSVQGIAVDGTSGDVYVYDAAAGAISKFDQSGTPVGFTGLLGQPNVIEGVGTSGDGESGLAVDNSNGPAKGDIYLASGSRLEVFSATGVSLGEITEESGRPWGLPCGVAVDGTGSVYVGLYPDHVNKYTPAGNPVLDGDYVSSLWGLSRVCNIAADTAGSVYADSYPEGPVFKYGALQFSALELAASGAQAAETGRAPTVDSATDDLYVSLGSEVAQYDAAGALITRFAGGAGPFGNSHALAVNATTGRVYVSDNEHGRVDVFGGTVLAPDTTTTPASTLTTVTATLNGSVDPLGSAVTACEFEYGASSSYGHSAPCTSLPGGGSGPVGVSAAITGLEANTASHYRLVAGNAKGTSYGLDSQLLTLSPPLVNGKPPTGVAVHTATLGAEVNPMGAATSYHFEYGTTSGYGTSTPTVGAGAGSEYQTASQPLTGLEANTTYHYRLLATSSNGTTTGPDIALTTNAEPTAAETDTCPNAKLRAENRSSALPDCRAYEKVSPLDKNGADIDGTRGSHTGIAAADGERVAYEARTGFAGSKGSGLGGGTQYVATRTVGGWSSQGITPTSAPDAWQTLVAATQNFAFSSDLTKSLVVAYDLPAVTNDAANAENTYLEDNQKGQLQAITTPLGAGPIEWQGLSRTAAGHSSDLGVVAFETPMSLLRQTDGLPNEELYAWEHGTLKLAGILPNGTVPPGGAAQAFPSSEQNEDVSSDGSRILFVSPIDGSAARQLYMRKNATSTVWVSESEASAPSPQPQEAVFQAASSDGTKILFTSVDRLTDSDPGGGQLGLYLYTDGPEPAAESNLTFIARIGDASHVNRRGLVVGMSQDGSHIYFTSEQDEPGLPSGTYLWDSGTIHEVAPGSISQQQQQPRVSSDGQRLAFMSTNQLTSQPTGDHPETPYVVDPFAAMYFYEETAGSLKCVSCLPSGAAVTQDVQITPYVTEGSLTVGYVLPVNYTSDDGRYTFFSTADALVPQDTNGLYDVYEYDAETGKVALLSSGAGDSGSWFLSTSASGHDAFFLTAQRLLAGDTDGLVDLYDARVDGGLPEPAGALAACAGDACQGTPSAAPTFNTASGFSGLGNQAVNSVAKHKAKAKAKAKKKAKPKHKARQKQKAKSKQRKAKKKQAKKSRSSGRQPSRRARG
jgi:hypothetical protein